MSDHESACSNSVGGLNLNEINISAHNADCQVRMIDALGPEIYAGLVRDGSLDPVIDVSNIDQTIQNKNKATCVMNSMQKSHSDQMSSVDNTALQESIQDMEGGGNINSDQGKCTEINTSQSACEYVKDKQCCMNSVTESRENLLSVGDCFSHVHDINQLIDTENDLTCASSDYQFQDTGQGTVVKDVETQRAKQAVTPNYAIYIGGAIVAVLLGLAGMYLLYKGGKLAYSKSPMGLAGSVMGDKPMPSAPPASALGGRWDALRSHDLRGAMGWQ